MAEETPVMAGTDVQEEAPVAEVAAMSVNDEQTTEGDSPMVGQTEEIVLEAPPPVSECGTEEPATEEAAPEEGVIGENSGAPALPTLPALPDLPAMPSLPALPAVGPLPALPATGEQAAEEPAKEEPAAEEPAAEAPAAEEPAAEEPAAAAE